MKTANPLGGEPIVSVNPAASARQITDSIQSQLPRWKQERDLSEKRNRSDKYADYLRVWDLREGWTGVQYDYRREQKLREVAETLKVPLPTANHHYRNGFELIIGHPYSPEHWRKTMGMEKLSELFTDGIGPVSRRRPLSSPVRRDVAESVLTGGAREDRSNAVGPVTSTASSDSEMEFLELANDILTLIRQGRTDPQIMEVLERRRLSRKCRRAFRRRGR